MKNFHIYTIANDMQAYAEMKESFLNARFDEDRCEYSVFDNSMENTYDPYRVLDCICSSTVEKYIILCHQDVLLNQGHGYGELLKVIEQLSKLDSSWSILGNAGFNNSYKRVVRVTDPHKMAHWSAGLPEKVHSLDENFLIINSAQRLHCSPELSGFHLYGADLCLNAISRGCSCYVIDFHLSHLSAGNQNQAFHIAQSQFKARWSREFKFCYFKPMAGSVLLLSRYKILQDILSSNIKINKAIGWWLICHTFLRNLVSAELRS
jgi:hypothetical protein